MKNFLCLNPNYEKMMQYEFQRYAINILYGDIVMGSDIIANQDSDEE